MYVWVCVSVLNIEAIQGMLTHALNDKFELEIHIKKASVLKFKENLCIFKNLQRSSSVCEIYLEDSGFSITNNNLKISIGPRTLSKYSF